MNSGTALALLLSALLPAAASAVEERGKPFSASTLELPMVTRSRPVDVTVTAEADDDVASFFRNGGPAPQRPGPKTGAPAPGPPGSSLASASTTLRSAVFLDAWAEAPPFVRQTDQLVSAIASYNRFHRVFETGLTTELSWGAFGGRPLRVALALDGDRQVDHVFQVLSRLRDETGPSGVRDGAPDYIDRNGNGTFDRSVDERIWYEVRRRRHDSVFSRWKPAVTATWGDPSSEHWKLSYKGRYSRDERIWSVYGDFAAGASRDRDDRTDVDLLWKGPVVEGKIALEAGVRLDAAATSSYPLEAERGNAPLWIHRGAVPFGWFDLGTPHEDLVSAVLDEAEAGGVRFTNPTDARRYVRDGWWARPFVYYQGGGVADLREIARSLFGVELMPFWECASDGWRTPPEGYRFQTPEDSPEMPVPNYRQGGMGQTFDARRFRTEARLRLEKTVHVGDSNLAARAGLRGRHTLAVSLALEETRFRFQTAYTSGGPAPVLYHSRPYSQTPGTEPQAQICAADPRRLAPPVGGGFGEVFYVGAWQRSPTSNGILRPDVNYVLSSSAQGVPESGASFRPTLASRARGEWLKLGLADRWESAAIPGFSAAAGLEWQPQVIYGPSGRAGLAIWDNLAPRLGLFLHPGGDARSLVSGHARRVYKPLPMMLYQGPFTREALVSQRYVRDTATGTWTRVAVPVPGDTDPFVVQGGYEFPVARVDTRAGLDPETGRGFTEAGRGRTDVRGEHSDEFGIAATRAFSDRWRFSARLRHRVLRQVIEDVSIDGGGSFVVGNPGRGALRSGFAYDPASGGVVREDGTIYSAPKAFPYPRPWRNHTEVHLDIARALSENWAFEAWYRWQRVLGNIPEAEDAEGLRQSFSAIYDLPELTVNRNGPLPTDFTHLVRVAATFRMPVGRLGHLDLRGETLYRTGPPIEVRGPHTFPQYRDGEIFILPRGRAGRLPDYRRTDISLSWEFPISSARSVTLSGRVYNLFNWRTPVRVEQRFTTYALTSVEVGGKGGVQPVENGTMADLPDPQDAYSYGKLMDFKGKTPIHGANVSPYFGRPVEYQSPRAFALELTVEY